MGFGSRHLFSFLVQHPFSYLLETAVGGNQLFFSLSLTYSGEVVSISQILGEAYDLGLTNQDVPSPLACVSGGTHDPS